MEPTFEGHAYQMDAKPALGSSAASWKLSDCSGFVRWLLFDAAMEKIPDGSVQQHAWCAEYLPACSYAKCAPLSDNVLRIAFMAPTATEAGHVWLIVSGLTIECWGGHGPGRRPYDTPVLLEHVCACYELAELV